MNMTSPVLRTRTIPAASAGPRRSSPEPPASRSSATVGREVADARSRTSCVSGGTDSMRSWSRLPKSSGTGSGSPGGGSPSTDRIARTISRPNNGLPPDASWILTRIGREKRPSVRSWINRVNTSKGSGPTSSRRQTLTQRRLEVERIGDPFGDPQGREHRDGLGLQTSQDERQGVRGRRVDPLHVVDGEQHRSLVREQPQGTQDRHGNGVTVRAPVVALSAEQCDLQRPALGSRELIGHMLEAFVQQIGEGGVGERRLRLPADGSSGRRRPLLRRARRLGATGWSSRSPPSR